MSENSYHCEVRTMSTTTTYQPTRPIMTRDELAAAQVGAYGRDYSRSDDGYDDMDVAAEDGWVSVSGWGRDGYDLGDWPYVTVSTKILDGSDSLKYATTANFGLLTTCEGDHTRYHFKTREDLYAAIDYLFIWYGIGREYDEWAVLGIGGWSDELKTYPARDALDAGTLRVPAELRGPFSWKRCDEEHGRT